VQKIIAGVLAVLVAFSAQADEENTNLRKVIEVARSLDWPAGETERRAYLLVKTRTVRSPVALVFGYADNWQACQELAFDLTVAANARALSPGPDLYVCDAVY